MSDESEKQLYGSSVALPETDMKEQEERADDASVKYDIVTIEESIGTPSFRFIFPNLINNIKILPRNPQRLLCEKIIAKIEEVYEFTFYYNIPTDSQKDFNDIYDFISHLEYKYFDFVSHVWNFLGVDLKETNIPDFCKNRSGEIITEIEEQIDIRDIPWLFSIFMRTYNKEHIIKWFCKISIENRIDLILNQVTGEDHNEE